jgi:AcrR family transcriptional regulator
MNKRDGRLVKGEATRAHLVETALSVFAEKGFARATIKDLGVAAGMSPAILYHYFKGKEELLQAVVERYSFVGDVRRLIDAGESLPIGDFLRALTQRFYVLIGERLDLVRIFLQEGASNETVAATWKSLLSQGFPLLSGYFNRQIALGRLRPHSAEVTVRTLGTAVVMLRFTEHILPPQTVSGPEFIDQLVDNLLSGLLPGSAASGVGSKPAK